MNNSAWSLLKTRRFVALFIVQFLGAFNDNVFRFALLTLITYQLASQLEMKASILNMVAAGIFILPFFLFSASSGLLADKYQKHYMIRLIKLFEVLIMVLASAAFVKSDILLLMFCLGLTGLQSALFGPVKYGILPALLKESELLAGNAFVGAGTFLSILLGTIVGGLLILGEFGGWQVSAVLLLCALMGWIASMFIPQVQVSSVDVKPSMNIFKDTLNVYRIGTEKWEIRRVILGISWFWFLGYVVHSQLAPMTSEVLQADEQVAVLLLVMFTIGIGVGSLLCSRILGAEISARYVPFAGMLMSLFSFDLYLSMRTFQSQPVIDGLRSISEFLTVATNWRILIDMFLLSIFAGFYIVPLYTLLQKRSAENVRSRTIAANNIMNALFMVVASGLVIVAIANGFGIPDLFWMLAILNVIVAIYIMKIIPKQSLQTIGRLLFKVLYRVEVLGLENYPKDGSSYVIVSNHVSLLDGPLLVCFLPDMPVFAINTDVNKKWWAKVFTQFFEMFPLDPTRPMAIKGLVKMLRSGRKVAIFPEGRLTQTGSLMKVYEGPGKIADMGNAKIIPVRIRGAEYTPFGRLKGLQKIKLFPKITLTICPSKEIKVAASIRGSSRRRELRRAIYDIMTEMMYLTTNIDTTLFNSLAESINIFGRKHEVLEDIQRKPITLGKVLLGSVVLGKALETYIQPRERVGMMLPNAIPTAVTFYALQQLGAVPAMLNFTMGTENFSSAVTTAKIKTVLTSRKFIELGELSLLEKKLKEMVKVIYLEDIKDQIGPLVKIAGMLKTLTGKGLRRNQPASDSPAVILFTSGSEGAPKGVVLTHKNLLANRAQVKSCLDFSPKDRFFNALPVFHSFGLGVGLVLPMSSGIRTFLYPSPLHYKAIPELVYDTQATVIFGTDTFLNGYATHGDPEDFQSTRYVIAGAEKLKAATREKWVSKFGVRIFEGYGVTETSPALSINTYSYNKVGSVGRLFPGIKTRLEKVPGIERGGRLWVSGDNIMLGYLKIDAPGVVQELENGWHDTGDIVDIDDEGFLTILGRAKRFAKIGGEMVSLTQVEGLIASLWPQDQHCVSAVLDKRKGEKLVLITTYKHADRKQLQQFISSQGGAEIMVPREILFTKEIPLLGTGKLNYAAIQQLANDQFAG